MTTPTATPPSAAAPHTPAAPYASVRAADLLGPARRVVIEHGNERYVLSLTRNGKLLLTK